MWYKLNDKKPELKAPVLVYRPGFFKHLYNVCIYDGHDWRMEAVGVRPAFRFRAWAGDYWAYLYEVVPVPAVQEF